ANAVRGYFENPLLHKTTINDITGKLAGLYGVTGVPSFFILDGKGQIRFIERGYTTSFGLRLRLMLANSF
ncbi:MAG: protein disulfide oxidoreductase, partial [Spirochaetia bacterium]